MKKKHHFVPQTYLTGFSCNRDDERKPFIWRYTMDEYILPTAPIPIESVAYSKLLYEMTDANGDIVAENALENALGGFENLFSQYRRKIESRIKICNPGSGFLTSKERVFWMIYTILQLYRTPDMLSMIERFTLEYNDSITENQAHNIARMFALPLLKDNPLDSEEGRLFRANVEMIQDKAVSIGYCNKGMLVTSDDPVIVFAKTPTSKMDEVWFPLTAQIFLRIHEKENPEVNGTLYLLDDNKVERINQETILHARRDLYSSRRLTKREKDIVKEESFQRKTQGDQHEEV